MSEIGVEKLDGSPDEWNAFAVTQDSGRFSHLYEWPQLLRDVYGGQPHYLVASTEGENVGLAPLMLRSVIGEGKVLYATPFADEGGFCTDDPEVEQALTKAAVDLGERIGADYLEVRQRRPLDGNYPCDESRVTLEMPLPDDSEVLWDDLSKNLRKKVRRARRDGLVCEEASSEMLPVFYDVYAANMQELGSPMHSAEFFEALFKRLPEDMFLLVVKLEEEDKPVGAAVAIRFSDRLTVLCAHSLREFFDLYPNNLLYWRIFEVAIENGCRVANFGRSPVDSGIYRYKKSWHMEDHQLYYTRVPIHSEPTIDDSRESTSYSLFRKVWPKLPSSIARSIGPRIWARLPI